MPSPRSFLCAAALAVVVGPASCKKPQQPSSDAPLVITGTPDADGGAGGSDVSPAATRPGGKLEKIQITASVSNLAEIFAVFTDMNQRFNPDGSSDAKSELQAALLQSGFAPSFLDNIDLAGVHAMWAAYPMQGGQAGAKDANLAASIGVIDGRKVIEAAPSSSRPQPLGDGMWELKSTDGNVLIKESGKELLIGMSPEDIARAAKLRSEAKADHRFAAKVWNIPKDDLDPASLFGLPSNSKLAKDLGKVIKDLGAVELLADVGMAKDASMLLSAEAPFSKLGIEPLGKARAASTAIEAKLPDDPMLVTTLSWGDPALVTKMINEQVPVAMIPEPFTTIVKQTMTAATTLLGQISNDVVFAVYVDSKGKLTAVIAADVKDDAKTREAMRSISDAIKQSVDAQQALAGSNKAAHVGLEWKPGGVAAGSAKADRLVLRAPKEMADDLAGFEFFLDKGAVEAVSFAEGGTAFVAIGPGAKALTIDVLKNVAKPRKSSLAQHEGLGRLRTSLGGCQICVSMDPVAYLRFRVALLAAKEAKDKTIAKRAKTSLADLKKIGSVGEPSLGVKVEAKKGALGVLIPKEAVFAKKESIAKLIEINTFVEDGAMATAPVTREEKAPAARTAPPKTAPAKKAPAKKAG
jgi:hypothetical protein